ncbi:RNA-binding riboflavin kinase RibR [compost metagenome]
MIPANGVYAIRALVNGKSYDGVMNVGIKPTFDTGQLLPSLEAHLFDFSADIYGEWVTVELVAFLREERKFNGIEELIAQIKRDADTSKSILLELL